MLGRLLPFVFLAFSLSAAPLVSSFSPATGPASGGTILNIAGSGFEPGAAVRFGAVPSTVVTFLSSTSLRAVAPPQEPSAVAVVVTNPDGSSANKTGFLYTAVQTIAITSMTPSTGSSAGGEQVSISGSGFQPGASATLGGMPLFNLSIAPNLITATTPSGPANFATNVVVDVAVRNPDGASATSGKAFTYSRPALAITEVAPRTASPAGGTTVTIIGRGFTTALPLSVTFGGVAATDATVVNTFTIVATAPPHAAGSVDVSVTHGGATVSIPGAVRYEVAPRRRRAL